MAACPVAAAAFWVAAGTSSPSHAKQLRFLATQSQGEVAALLLRPADADRLLVFAHGAGADMRHTFMQAVAERLNESFRSTISITALS